MTEPTDHTFQVTVNRRKIRISYRHNGPQHIFSSPDVPNATTVASDKNKAYTAFMKRLKEVVV